MIILNPFTGQVLNTWSDEARKASAESRKRKAGRSYEGSKKLIFKRLLHEVTKEGSHPESYATLEYKDRGPKALGGFLFGGGRYDPKLDKRVKTLDIEVSKGPYERELAMHEVGHAATQDANEDAWEKDINADIDEEGEAWKWALKNAKKNNISKRKLRRIKRSADYSNALYPEDETDYL